MAASDERLATAAPPYYVWSFPGSPIKVHLDLELVKRMAARFRLAGAAPAGGLLCGETDGQVTRVHDFQPLLRTEDADVTRAIAALAAAPGTQAVVGYCRTQQGDTLRLNERDLTLAEAFFRDPRQVFLLVQSSEAGPGNASFFFREGDHMNGDFPFLEFPFDADLLAAAERHRAETTHRRTVERSLAAVTAAPPVGHKPSRGRAVWKAAAWTALAAAVVGVAAVGLRGYPEKFSRLLSQPAPSAGQTISAQPSLGLQAERQNSDLKLTWSRDAAVIASATSGVLSIQDGPSQRELQLQQAQVRGGSILYSPVSDQVQMQLAVSSPAGNATESVIVILPRTGPPQVQPVSPQPAPARRMLPPPPALGEASRVAASKPFTVPLAANPGAARTAVPTDEPPALTANSMAAPAAPAVLVRQIPAPASSPPGLSSPSSQLASPAQPPIAPAYRPAEAIRQALPVFPAALRPVLFRPKTVEVNVSIDETGKVVKAVAIPRKDLHQMLIGAAETAARQWRFRPAQRDNQAIPSQMVLRFNFQP